MLAVNKFVTQANAQRMSISPRNGLKSLVRILNQYTNEKLLK